MTKEEFVARFRGPMLLFLTESWAARREAPSAVGILLEQQYARAKSLMEEMHAALSPPNNGVKQHEQNGRQAPNGSRGGPGTTGAEQNLGRA